MSDVAALYRMYGPIIYARCVRLLSDRAAAEDATQETFIRVQRHLAKAPAADEALRWIYRIATNYCLNELRNRKLRPIADEVPERAGTELDFSDRDLVARIIRRAPEEVRTAAWLHHVDGLDQSEVAQVLDVSRRTVVNRLAEFATNARKFAAREAS